MPRGGSSRRFLDGIADEYEEVVEVWRRRSGLRAVVAIHSTVRGPALGGTRFYPYDSEAAGFEDVVRLARAMSYKAAVAGLPLGGGKAVIIGDPRTAKSKKLLRDYADLLNSLEGRYITAEDVGTSQADMDELGQYTRFVAGRSRVHGGSGDPSPLTAYGVVRAMEAASLVTWGSDELGDRHIAISGIGKVGSELARLLLERGCRLTVADASSAAVQQFSSLPGVDVVEPEHIHRSKCDIFAPCALGGVLNEVTVPELNCEMVVGAANNQLSDESIAESIQELGIVYVPDYVANAGGLINIANEYLGYDEARARRAVSGIFSTVENLVHESTKQGCTPLAATQALALQRLGC